LDYDYLPERERLESEAELVGADGHPTVALILKSKGEFDSFP
jgi:hypothetical protein